YPDDQELTLYRHNKRRYVSVKPNERERLPIPDLELEVVLLEGWVRFWYQRQLLPLPADLQRDLDEARQQVGDLQRRLAAEQEARRAAEQELARLRAQLGER